MKKIGLLRIWLGISGLVFASAGYGQKVVSIDVRDNFEVIDRTVDPAQNLDEILPPPPDIEGSFYLYKEWQPATIYLSNRKNTVIKNYDVKINLENKIVELRTEMQIKVIPYYLVDVMLLHNDMNEEVKFINIADHMQSDEYTNELYRVLWENDNIKLLAHSYVYFKESTYVTAIDMGEKDHKLIKKQSHHLLDNGELHEFFRAKNKNREAFGEYFNEIEKYRKRNKLKYSREEDLKLIVSHYAGIKKS